MGISAVESSKSTIPDQSHVVSPVGCPAISPEQAHSETSPAFCGHCLAPIPPSRRRHRAKWCSTKCADAHRYGPKVTSTMSPAAKNTAAKMLVTADLLMRGFEIFQAAVSGYDSDLAIRRTGQVSANLRKLFWCAHPTPFCVVSDPAFA